MQQNTNISDNSYSEVGSAGKLTQEQLAKVQEAFSDVNPRFTVVIQHHYDLDWLKEQEDADKIERIESNWEDGYYNLEDGTVIAFEFWDNEKNETIDEGNIPNEELYAQN